MALRYRIQYLRKEHEELLHLADRIEKMLESASKNDFAEHLKSLTGLRSLEHGLAGIVEHCHAENRIVESTYHQYLQQDERARIDAEHEQIIRVVTNFREELKFATTDRTMAMILPGMDVVNHLRAHIAYERELLGRIAEVGNPPKRTARRRKPIKRAHAAKRRHVAKRKAQTRPADVLPYTLEPHPEL
jgi:hypothetical protein